MLADSIRRFSSVRGVPWIRLLVIAAVLILAAVLPGQLVGQPARPEIWLLLAAGLAGVVMLKSPKWGVVLLVVGAVTPPGGIGTGTQAVINPAMLLVAGMTVAWVVRMLLVERRLHVTPTAANWPLLGLVLAAILSVIAGQVFGDPGVLLPANYVLVQAGGLSLVFLSVAAFWLGANVIREVGWLKLVIGLVIVLGMLAILNAILMISGLPLPYLFPGVHGLYWMWAPALAYGQILFNRKLGWPVKAFLWLSIAAWIWWAWGNVTDFLAGWLPLFIAIMMISWFRSRALAVFLLGVLVAWVVFRWDFYYQRIWIANQGSLNRPQMWATSLSLFGGRQPLLGLGPATYSWYATAYGLYFRQSHSNYVDMYLQYGVLGLICVVAVFALALRQAWLLKDRWLGTFERGYVIAIFGGLCGALAASVVADWVLPQVYNIGWDGFRHSMFTWFLSGGLVALGRIKHQQDEGAR